MTLAVIALFADGPTTLTGIASWRVKETDRIAAMATELAQARRDASTTGADRLRVTRRTQLACRRPSTPTTTTGWRCASRWPRSAASRSRSATPVACARRFPDYFAAFSASVIGAGVSRRHGCRRPGHRVDGPAASGKGTIAEARRRRRWASTTSTAARCTGWSRSRRCERASTLGRRGARSRRSPRRSTSRFAGGRIRLDGAGRDRRRSATRRSRAAASRVAVHPAVRAALLDRQRAFRRPPGLVADGRDMGTVVFPGRPAQGVRDGQRRRSGRAGGISS